MQSFSCSFAKLACSNANILSAQTHIAAAMVKSCTVSDVSEVDAVEISLSPIPENTSETSTIHVVPEPSISETGITTPAISPMPTPDPSLYRGVQDSEAIQDLQKRLMRLGYLDIDETTMHFGPETTAAIMEFQERNGLTADGLAGEKTFDLLYSPNAKPSSAVEKQERRRANIYEMIDAAKEQLGDPYVLGDEGPDSFDCSGLVYYCLKQAGSNRSRYNAAGYRRNTTSRRSARLRNGAMQASLPKCKPKN